MVGLLGLERRADGHDPDDAGPDRRHAGDGSFQNGFWSARSWEFYQQPIVNRLLWLRMMPDTVFIVAGVLPIAAAALWGMANMRRADVDGPQISSPHTPEAVAELVNIR